MNRDAKEAMIRQVARLFPPTEKDPLLSMFTDAQLLAELVRRNGVAQGATFRTSRPIDTLVGIGKDHSIFIGFFADDLAALHTVANQKFPIKVKKEKAND